MSSSPQTTAGSSRPLQRFGFQLLRYAPNLISGEFFNLAVILRNEQGTIVDARFAGELARMRCHPGVEREFVDALRQEFEEFRLLGEGFSEYLEQLTRRASYAVYVSEPQTLWSLDVGAEVDRLVQTYLADPPGARSGGAARTTGGRKAVRQAIRDALERHSLVSEGRVRRDWEIEYGGPRLKFKFDFRYRTAAGAESFLQAFTARNEIAEAGRLCLVYERLSAREEGVGALIAIHESAVSGDALELLRSSRIEATAVDDVDAVALRVRAELGL